MVLQCKASGYLTPMALQWLPLADPDVKADFGTASILKNGRVAFNIAGNKYRIVTSINYPYGIVFIKFIGIHRQYDVIDAQTI